MPGTIESSQMAQLRKPIRRKKVLERGFSLFELLIVVAITLVVAGFAIPGYLGMMRNLRIAGDIRDINATIALAKMRAAQDFTHARVNAHLTLNTYALEVWDKAGNAGAGCWRTEGDAAHACSASDSPTIPLSQGVNFGFGSATAGGLNPQSTIAQASPCTDSVAGGAAGNTLGNSSCIEFNSRGVPVASNGSPTANDALYITDTNTVYGVTVIVSGLIQVWGTGASVTSWQAR